MAKDYAVKIVETMQKVRQPMILQHVALKSSLTAQATRYQLDRLIETGIVNIYEDGDEKFYVLQAAYYDEKWLEALYALMTPYVEGMTKKMDFSQTKQLPPKAVISNLIMFLKLFERKVKRIK